MSTFVSLADLVEWLKLKAAIQDSEESAFSAGNLRSLIQEAVSKHNPNYSVSDTASTVPSREKECVTTLACASIALIRAFQLSTSSNSSANGFSTEHDSPFSRCLKLNKHLLEVVYPADLLAAGVTSTTTGPVMSELTTLDKSRNIQTNPHIVKAPPAVVLSVFSGPDPGGFVIISVASTSISNFSTFRVFVKTGDDSIREVWNFASTVFPQIAEGSSSITFNSIPLSFKLQDLPAGPSTLRVIACLVNTNELASYSNELVIDIPA